MSCHPEIIKLTSQLFPIIGSFLKGKGLIPVVRLCQFVKEQQIKGLTFRGVYHSYQLEYVITNLIRKGLLEESGALISLSIYGESKLLIDNNNGEK